jgi:rhodanese-related sulfurtransferase
MEYKVKGSVIMWRLGVLISLLMMIAVAGCSNPASTTSALAGEDNSLQNLPVNISIATVDSLRQRDDVVLIDVREDWEYAAGHIPGTVLIPLGQLSSRLAEIPTDKTVIAVCRSDNRSGQATRFLKERGFTVHNMTGGMIAWEQAGYAVEK